MAPLPESNTGRIYIDYQNAYGQHTLQVRGAESATFAEIDAGLNALFVALSPVFVDTEITAARYSAQGFNFSLPYDSSLPGTGFGAGIANGETNATALTFVGRDNQARRARLSIFGFKLGLSIFRYTAGENADVDAAINVLKGRPQVFQSISGVAPVWYNYADVKANDYWVRRARGGG